MTQFRLNLSIGGVIEAVEPPRAVFTARLGSFTAKGQEMAYTLPADKMIEVAVAYVDSQGNTVDLPQGNVAWETSDDTLLSATPDAADDQKCALTPEGPIGAAQVTCTGTNVSGSKVIAVLDVNIVAGDAVTGTIQPVGTPQPVP